MTIQSTDRKAGPFLSGTALPFEFKVFSKEDIAVIYTDAEGVEVVLVLDSDYSVTLNADQDDNPGGTATLTTSIVSGDRANIIGDLAYDQGTDIRNQGGFEPEIIEDALDRATIQIQQLKEITDRTLKTAPGDSRTGDELLADIFEADASAAASAAAAEESANRVDLGALDQAVEDAEAAQLGAQTAQGLSEDARDQSQSFAVDAEESASLAEAAKAESQTARDAAFVNADVYASTAAGLAATTVGDQFQVVDGLYVFRYLHETGPVATEVARYPSASFVAGLTLFPNSADADSNELAVFSRIKSLRLYGADPSKFYFVTNFFWKDVGTRLNLTIAQADDESGTSVASVALFSLGSGADAYTGHQELILDPVSGSGISAAAVIDFSDSSSFAIYAPGSPEGYEIRVLSKEVIQNNQAGEAVAQEQILSTLNNQSVAGWKIPFVDTILNDYLIKAVRSIWLYGADPANQYIVSAFNFEQFAGIPLTRAIIDIKDLTNDVVVCRYRYQVGTAPSIADFLLEMPTTIKLNDELLSPKTQVYAVMEIDREAITAYATENPTTRVQGGIHESRVMSDDRIADYLDRDFWHETIPVGAGQTYTTLRGALEGLYRDGSIGDFTCDRSHYHNRILIDLIDDGEYNATLLTIPEFVEVRGNGRDRTFIRKENNDPDALLEAHLDTKFFDCTIVSETGNGSSGSGEYCIHSDDFNNRVIGGKAQNRRLRQKFKRLRLVGGDDQDTWLYGSGISSGQTMRFEDVILEHRNSSPTFAALGIHNTGPTLSVPDLTVSEKPAFLELVGVRSLDMSSVALYLQSLHTSAKCCATLIDCDFSMVVQEIASGGEVITDRAADRFQWDIGGVHSGPIRQSDPDGAFVLATAAGATVTGDASALIFGDIDELGRGELWIKDGTIKSLGSRLGDCSSVSKTLTINGVSHVFSTDLTAVSNATIIAAINGSIPLNPVSEVDIQLESFPDTGFTRKALNDSGVTIPKGRFVKRTGQGTIALAQPGDPIFGWAYRDILNGLVGNVVITKQIAQDYIEGANSSTGSWGLSTDGVLDYAATQKIGYTQGGVVYLF